ncbi:MAG: Arm DNA-binding domain-containing protein [Rickettsiales bacterium]|nr:Arm DNA-binding domain-containing protein [Rickettsiales bacterium]
MKLTDIKCKNAKFYPDEKPNGSKHKLSDGGGLFLHIKPQGKYWRLQYRFDGKQKLLALGVYPQVTLAEAREARDKAKKLLQNNIGLCRIC